MSNPSDFSNINPNQSPSPIPENSRRDKKESQDHLATLLLLESLLKTMQSLTSSSNQITTSQSTPATQSSPAPTNNSVDTDTLLSILATAAAMLNLLQGIKQRSQEEEMNTGSEIDKSNMEMALAALKGLSQNNIKLPNLKEIQEIIKDLKANPYYAKELSAAIQNVKAFTEDLMNKNGNLMNQLMQTVSGDYGAFYASFLGSIEQPLLAMGLPPNLALKLSNAMLKGGIIAGALTDLKHGDLAGRGAMDRDGFTQFLSHALHTPGALFFGMLYTHMGDPTHRVFDFNQVSTFIPANEHSDLTKYDQNREILLSVLLLMKLINAPNAPISPKDATDPKKPQ